MSMFDNLRDKGEGLVDEHGEQAGGGLDKAGDVVDEKTGGQHSEHIDQGVEKAKDALDRLDGQDDDIP
jgi:hypothetical protein